jgi:hypothetical protein
MIQYGTWSPYAGSEAILLAAVLLVIGCTLAFVGTRLHRSIEIDRPGKVVSILLVTIWVLSLVTFLIAISAYMKALVQQIGVYTPPKNPISPITFLSGLVTFIVIIYLCRFHGWKIALGSAIVGAAAAPMIFELPFDLIIMWRTYPPTPATLFTLLYFLPLFIVEIATFSLLTLSPIMKLSKYTLFSLAAMFFVFTIWALFGFSYPFAPIPIALNMVSKILSFIAAITLFLPQKGILTKSK